MPQKIQAVLLYNKTQETINDRKNTKRDKSELQGFELSIKA
jgi:hypothetical protein